jgi:hypothetical protein
MPNLARYLQEAFERDCPKGWVCRSEARVVSDEVEELLGYAPQADAVLQEVATGRRVWVELEVSRADPVANHAKFATAHLVSPMPTGDAFVSMVSRHVVRGRSNLAAHTVGLMRAVGIRAFQTPLLPGLDGEAIKTLNHLPMDRLRDEAPEPKAELDRAMSVAGSLGIALESDIHFAANAVEVVYNIHRWNLDMTRPELRELWRKRSVRYFAHDPRSGLFAPSKFAAYLLMPTGTRKITDGFLQSLTGMGVRAYTEIDKEHPLFDGNRAWDHLHRRLGMGMGPLDQLGAKAVDRFWRWAERFADVVGIDSKGPVVLTAPEWGY